jgi:acetyl-CoA acetyltransferase
VHDGGVVTFGSQTHPADGAAGTLVMSRDDARTLAGSEGVVRLLSAGFARAEKARMPKAATTAALRALEAAGVGIADVHVVTTHNPFAVNDLWFAQQTGFALERMNPYGCSLVYGHPQGPTGLRAIAELVQALKARGGGIGLFTGCAAGDTGAALLVRLE